jgi:hypothetical protein
MDLKTGGIYFTLVFSQSTAPRQRLSLQIHFSASEAEVFTHDLSDGALVTHMGIFEAT